MATGILGTCLSAAAASNGGETISPPRFLQRVEVTGTRNRSAAFEVDIAGAKELLLVVSGARWGWADWAEPRLIGPAGELRLTDLAWKFASSGYGQPQVNANPRGEPLRISGAAVPYGIGVHDPSLVIYDLPPGYTHFLARVGLDDAGRGPVTFMVYADCPFFAPGNAMLGRRDVHRELPGEPLAFVETIGGDRLPGVVVAAGSADDGAFPAALPCLIVQSPAAVNHPESDQRPLVRVIERFVQRIVWQAPRAEWGVCEPGEVRTRNGSRLSFRSARFVDRAVKLLTAEGVQTIALADLAEIHLPCRDPWDAYCDELAVLSPDAAVPLVHLETDGGLAVTASRARLRYLPPQHHDSEPMRWHLGLQPAWSADLLWLSETGIVARREFAPDRVPLTRLRPGVVQPRRGMGSGDWLPRKNHNARGLELASGGQRHGWGFGVQANCELHFALPPYAERFRTRVGLDALAGDGGCARARVFAEPIGGSPLWESPLLIGSSRSFDSGPLPLPAGNTQPSRLVLQADAAHEQRPTGADPFEIRDLVNWLDPELTLRTADLREAIAKQWVRWVPAWEGWQITSGDSTPLRLANWWDDGGEHPSRFTTGIAIGAGPLTITRQLDLNGPAACLRIAAAVRAPSDRQTAEIEVLLDGTSIHRGPLPSRSPDRITPPEMIVPLAAPSGTSTATVSVVLHPLGEPLLVEWCRLDVR